jgi:hypothetical protein
MEEMASSSLQPSYSDDFRQFIHFLGCPPSFRPTSAPKDEFKGGRPALKRPTPDCGARMVLTHVLGLGCSQMPASNSTLASRIDQAIQTNPYVNGRTLRFETDGSRVVLQGSVKSYFQKQMAQEAIRKVDGVEQIDNRVEVLWV